MRIDRLPKLTCLLLLFWMWMRSAPALAQDLLIELDERSRDWVRRDQTIRLVGDIVPPEQQGRLAILIGGTDFTDLFVRREASLEYRPSPLLLPSGESEIAVFLVSSHGKWREVARLPLRVLTDGGFEKRSVTPRLDVQGTNQLDARVRPAESAAGVDQNAASLNAHLNGELERNGWRVAGRMHTLGVSKQENALRFAQEGEQAPRFDLAEYSLRIERPADTRGFFELGHIAYNQHRFLVPSFASRGALVGVPLGKHGAATFATMNGSSIVGWRNLTGLEQSDHRITATSLGFELRPARPGALRIDVDYLNGSILPINGFNSAQIGDRQTNRAWGARLAGATESQRLRFEAGYARSEFKNPFDPTLAQGLDLIAVEPEDRAAHYADVTWDILQGTVLGANRTANLSLSLRHERVDPQYASIAAQVQSDVLRNTAQLNGALGPLQLQLSHGRMEDNLSDIPSILKTKTRRSDAMIALPLAQLVSVTESLPWLPVVSYNFVRVHQFGTGVPENSGFTEAHVPNQVSDSHGLILDWRGAYWGLSYRANYTTQDNRQSGRERADFATLVHAATLSLAAHERLDVNLELSKERSLTEEDNRIAYTNAVSAGFTLNATSQLSLACMGGLTRSEDEPRTNRSDNTFLDASLTYRFEWKTTSEHGLSGQLFLRYSDLGLRSHDEIFGVDVDNRTRTVIGGLTFGLR